MEEFQQFSWTCTYSRAPNEVVMIKDILSAEQVGLEPDLPCFLYFHEND
jgi:hypothetical protein